MTESKDKGELARGEGEEDLSSFHLAAGSGMAESLSEEEREEWLTTEGYVYELSVMLMRLDGNDGDPHQLLWCSGTIPEPWGDAWQRYEDQARKLLDVLGENMAWALLHEWPPKDSPADTKALPNEQNGCPSQDERVRKLTEALERLCGSTDDPNNGWRGNAKSSPDHFRCEYCGVEHLDCVALPHLDDCPVPAARAALKE